tara:strand:+ start:168 stop:542 length:375 start_codon:yes stop_codon:yes gene_type:complete
MRSSTVKQINPFVIFVITKKLVVYGAAEMYGFHRLYRRLLEGNKKHVVLEQQKHVRYALRESIRAPQKAASLLADSGVAEFLEKYSEDLMKRKNVPEFMKSLARTITKQSPVGLVYDFMNRFKK